MNSDPFVRLPFPASKFTPSRGKVLVRRDEATKTVGSILLPHKDTIEARREVSYATVLAIGAPSLDEKGRGLPVDFKVGERVVIDKYCGHDMMFSDGPAVVVGADSIVCAAEIEGEASPISGGFVPPNVVVADGPGPSPFRR